MSVAVVLAYLFYFTAASISPIQRRQLAKKDINHEGQTHFAMRMMFVMAACGLVLPFFQPFTLQGNSAELIWLALVCGVFGAGYYVAMFTAQKHVEAGLTTLITNIYTPVTIVLATIFLHEGLTWLQVIGAVLLISGMIIVAKKHRIGIVKFDKFFMMMLASGLMLGVYLTAERALQKVTGFSAGALISWWSIFAGLAIANLFTKTKSHYVNKDVIATGFFRFIQQVSWLVVLFVVGNLSIVSSVTTFKVIIIFVVAAVMLKEREDLPRKIMGCLIAVVGLLLMV
jgi:drug/metabolite transporter (DMT)-like permease